jgi:AmiR/NasT family two-component response regulator
MADATLLLLQKNASPLSAALKQALSRQRSTRLVIKAALPLPRIAYSPYGLVVWEVSDYDHDERITMMRELSSESLGVLLADQEQRLVGCQALSRLKPLGIIIRSEPLPALGVILDIAWAKHRRMHELRGELNRLRCELSDRLVVEKAKKLIMESLDYSEDDAMRRLQRYSRNTNQKMAKVAQQLIAGYDVLGKEK